VIELDFHVPLAYSTGLRPPSADRSISVIQLVEQRLGVLQIRGVEALGEPFVNLGERRAGSPLRLVSRSKRASEVVARNSRHFDSWEIATARADL